VNEVKIKRCCTKKKINSGDFCKCLSSKLIIIQGEFDMNILVVGNGGREHALCWKIAQSPVAENIFCAPGNAGTAAIAENIPIGVLETEKLIKFALDNHVDITIVGPEAPLCAGIVDAFKEKGLSVFGPDRASARLEGSKCYSKEFMLRHGIPTAESGEFYSRENALKYVKDKMKKVSRIVIKADGLAAGKGVLIAECLNDAVNAVNICFDGTFGKAGEKILIEEYLDGEETSILALTDGKSIVPLVPSQDHKRVGEGDTGLNTGGMGAYCPAPLVDESLMRKIDKKVLQRFLQGIQKDNLYYRGIIYAGIMVTKQGPKVLEFNVRFGDPEVQAVMSLMKSDFIEIIQKTAEGTLNNTEIEWHPGAAVCVVMASKGYPENYKKGLPISGIEDAEKNNNTIVFHAGTAVRGDKIITAGGRVLGVTSRGNSIEDAVTSAYAGVSKIAWDGAFYRKDIAYKAL
jgi:phosphoribosylamine---glycine ligase